jgi:hypothetical protein
MKLMTMSKTEQLARIQNRHTAYEVAAVKDGQRILILYTIHKSRHGLLSACRKYGEDVVKVLGIRETDMLIPAKRAADGFTLGAWSVRFTGRTQREAIIEGELPFVCDIAR